MENLSISVSFSRCSNDLLELADVIGDQVHLIKNCDMRTFDEILKVKWHIKEAARLYNNLATFWRYKS